MISNSIDVNLNYNKKVMINPKFKWKIIKDNKKLYTYKSKSQRIFKKNQNIINNTYLNNKNKNGSKSKLSSINLQYKNYKKYVNKFKIPGYQILNDNKVENQIKKNLNLKKNNINEIDLRKIANKDLENKLNLNIWTKRNLLEKLENKIKNNLFEKTTEIKFIKTKQIINNNVKKLKKIDLNFNIKNMIFFNKKEYKEYKSTNKDLIIMNNKKLFKNIRVNKKKNYIELIFNFWKKLINLNINIKEHINYYDVINPKKPYYMKNSKDFFDYVKANNIGEVNYILQKKKYYIFQFDYMGLTPLHWAIKKNYTEMTILLCKFKPKINQKDFLGRTPFYYSFYLKGDRLQKILLTFKANPWSNNCYKIKYSNIKNQNMLINLKNWRVLWILKLNFKTLEFALKDYIVPWFYKNYFEENIKPFI